MWQENIIIALLLDKLFIGTMANGGFNSFGTVHVDGVEMKLHERLNPPPQITLPANLYLGDPTEFLFMEHDFSLEENVIERSNRQKALAEERQRALEEAAKRAEEEEARKRAEEEEARKRAEQEAAEVAARCAQESASTEDASSETKNQESLNLDLNESNQSPRGADNIKPELEMEQTRSPVLNASSNHVTTPQATGSVVQYPVPVMTHQMVPTRTNQPMFYGAIGGILTPLPAQPSVRQQSTTSNVSSAFDPTDFENAGQDPFETVELKTLDDMAELNKVLQVVQDSQQSKTVSTVHSGISTSNVHINSVPNAGVVSYSAASGHPAHYANFSAYPTNAAATSSTQQTVPHFSSAQVPNSQAHVKTPSLKNVGYPDINLYGYTQTSNESVSVNANSHSVSFQSRSQPNGSTTHSSGNPWQSSNFSPPNSAAYDHFYRSPTIERVPQSVANNPFTGPHTQFTATQNSMPSSSVISNSCSGNIGSFPSTGHSTQAANYTNPFRPPDWTASNHQPPQQNSVPFNNNVTRWQEFYQQSSPESVGKKRSHTASNVSGGFESETGSKSQSHSRSQTPEPSLKGLRSAKSTSDLALFASGNDADFESTSGVTDVVAPNSYRTTVQQQTSHKNSVLQSLAKEFKVEDKSSKSIEMGFTPNHFNHMSSECKRFVNRISDMGFERTRVVSAVLKLGQDDKKVLDYLCGVNRLCQKGFDLKDAETALKLLNNDETKASKYLGLQNMFKEFGFSDEKIQEGLVKNELDEEKTLDWLTSC